jgi:PqqD family protein of HPr-rel-A system
LPPVYARRLGVQVEPLGEIWVAFSPACGETVLLNDASAALLEVLAEGPATTDAACRQLAQETGDDPAALTDAVAGSWTLLVESGLVEVLPPGHHSGP